MSFQLQQKFKDLHEFQGWSREGLKAPHNYLTDEDRDNLNSKRSLVVNSNCSPLLPTKQGDSKVK